MLAGSCHELAHTHSGVWDLLSTAESTNLLVHLPSLAIAPSSAPFIFFSFSPCLLRHPLRTGSVDPP